MQRALKNLPKSLNETYSRILCGIDDAYYQYAMTVLRCLTFSVRPTTVGEVLEATGIDYDTGLFDRDEMLLETTDILRICSSLVIVTTDEKAALEQISSNTTTHSNY